MHIVRAGMEHDVLKANNKVAHENFHRFKENGIRSIDFMGSIGSGKTTLIIEMGERLKAEGKRVLIVAGDVTGDDDYSRFKKAGLDAINCNTDKECHLDANLVRAHLGGVDLSKYDVVLVENVGNLVCPADFPLGTDYRAVIVSTTEGDDMVRKHHAVFQHSDVAIINKMDIADTVGVDPQIVINDYAKLTGGLKRMYACSAKKGEGVEEIIAAFGLRLKIQGRDRMVAMKVLTIGGGAREHAVVEALARAGAEIYAVMNNINPGIEQRATEVLNCSEDNTDKICDFALNNFVDYAFVGPEGPLASGIVDALQNIGVKCASPTLEAARIETSKTFMREIVEKYEIEGNLENQSFEVPEEAIGYLMRATYPVAIKPVGLTGGKGVKVQGDQLKDLDEAIAYIREIFDSNMGGGKVIIERKAEGEEFTQMVFTNGEDVIPMPLVQDHKRAYEGDLGPNTGGMGSYSDADHLLPFIRREERDKAVDIVRCIVKALAAEGCPYHGVMYGQFMLTKAGPKIIEINARFGDPEAMNVLTLLKSDFTDLIRWMAGGKLKSDVVFENKATVCKYVVPRGYGTHPEPGHTISVDRDAVEDHGGMVYFGNVDLKDGKLLTGTSRSIGIVGVGTTLEEANANCEKGLTFVKCDAIEMRHDIGAAPLLKSRIDHMNRIRGGQ